MTNLTKKIEVINQTIKALNDLLWLEGCKAAAGVEVNAEAATIHLEGLCYEDGYPVSSLMLSEINAWVAFSRKNTDDGESDLDLDFATSVATNAGNTPYLNMSDLIITLTAPRGWDVVMPEDEAVATAVVRGRSMSFTQLQVTVINECIRLSNLSVDDFYKEIVTNHPAWLDEISKMTDSAEVIRESLDLLVRTAREHCLLMSTIELKPLVA